MSRPFYPQKGLLVTGIMVSSEYLFLNLEKDLSNLFGNPVFLGPWFNFSHSDYYKAEMGRNLKKRLIAFKSPVYQDDLVKIKHQSWELEHKYLKDNRRSVNIDPGILTSDKFILSTGKNYSHRVYLGSGVFADLTLIFKKDGVQTFDWTYFDYKDNKTIDFLMQVRKYLVFLNSKPDIMKER